MHDPSGMHFGWMVDPTCIGKVIGLLLGGALGFKKHNMRYVLEVFVAVAAMISINVIFRFS
jgi:hypothetical protein